jgi:hypothetical protein
MKTKYDTCMAQSLNSRIYAFSWYLDAVADHWDVLVYGDYEAVMPLPWRQKMGNCVYLYTRLGSAIRCIWFKIHIEVSITFKRLMAAVPAKSSKKFHIHVQRTEFY